MYKYTSDGTRQSFVEGEPLARPVTGCAQPPQLCGDRAARLLFPFPHFAKKQLPPHPCAALLTFCEVSLHDKLPGNAGVIGAGLPKHVLAPHALETREHILQRVVECMAD